MGWPTSQRWSILSDPRSHFLGRRPRLACLPLPASPTLLRRKVSDPRSNFRRRRPGSPPVTTSHPRSHLVERRPRSVGSPTLPPVTSHHFLGRRLRFTCLSPTPTPLRRAMRRTS